MSSAPSSRLSLSAFSSQLSAFRSACPLALGALLRKYFASGWAFLIPYLTAYLLYYALKWPVNAASSEGGVKVASESGMWVPCLLHVYWTLHAINSVLAVTALVSWWRTSCRSVLARDAATKRLAIEGADEEGCPENKGRSPSPSLSLSLKIAPWLLLGLLFWIPGVYLEFPADPWQHYGRINEWSWLQTVGEHSAWTKSSYFLAYSLVGRIAPPTRQLFWLDFYYTGCCLLLCWQYYRLARAIGLGERASMFFVILQTVLFGNNIFGFYRYYGISSSIFAQLGAVALVRIAIEYAKRMGGKDTGVRSQESGVGNIPTDFTTKHPENTKTDQPSALGTLQPDIPMAHEGGVEEGRSPFRFPVSGSRNWLSAFRFPRSAFRLASCLLPFAASCALLLALCGFSHPQGLGIAGLGLLAVGIWRLIEWRRSMVWWLAAGALVLSVIAILFFPRNPALATYVRDGWLTSWYGFNVFAFSLPVGDRTLQIIGIIGLINFAAGLLLLRHNHFVGWLTITPLLTLSLPFVAIPLASALAQRGDPINIITFQRMLFAIPPGLALVALGEQIMHRVRSQELRARSLVGFSISRFLSFSVLLLSLSALLLVPANRPFYNRFWQALMVPPDDLTMKPFVSAAESAANDCREAGRARLVTIPAVANVFDTLSPRRFPFIERRIGRPIVESLNDMAAIPVSNRPTIESKCPTLIHDPFAVDLSAWTALAGSPPVFVTGINDFRASSTALQNRPGRRSDAFTSDLIKIDPGWTYRVEWSVKQCIDTNATVYLAVAWYDEGGRLLVSYRPAPEGAGAPAGWINGTYSYFGLVGTTAPMTWTTYRTSLGPDEEAAIPSGAKFVRVGALLNYSQTPAATIQLTNVRFWRKSEGEMVANGVFPTNERLLIVAPRGQMLWTYASQAGQASTHWPAQEAAADLAGGPELAAAARAADGTPIDPDGAIFFVEQNGSQPTKPVLQEGTKR